MSVRLTAMESAILLIGAAAVTLTICVNGFAVGKRLSVLAEPDDYRKFHKRPTPQIGGLAILSALVAWLAVMLFLGAPDRQLLYAAVLSAIGVGSIGFADDQAGLSPGARIVLVLVFLAAAFLVDREFVASRLNWASFEPTSISLWTYIPLIALSFGGMVNAVNMADGQDGVVGSMFVTWAGCICIITSGTSAAIAAVIFVLSAVFLFFNLRGKLFLGDCGSYGVTFVFGLLVTLAHARSELSLETTIVWFFIPVADCIRLMISRPLRGMSPFLGDRDHFHHRLEDKMGKRKGLLCYAGAVAASSFIATVEPRLALVCLCAIVAFYFSFAWLTTPQTAVQAFSQEPPKGTENVVSISADRSASKKRKGAA